MFSSFSERKCLAVFRVTSDALLFLGFTILNGYILNYYFYLFNGNLFILKVDKVFSSLSDL